MHTSRLSRLLPMFAIATGVALVGVTSAFKEAPKTKGGQDLNTFQYHAPGGSYSSSNVSTLSNWQPAAGTSGCDGFDQEACTIQVRDQFVNNPGTNSATLKSGFSITAATSDETNYYVSGISDDQGVVVNKSL